MIQQTTVVQRKVASERNFTQNREEDVVVKEKLPVEVKRSKLGLSTEQKNDTVKNQAALSVVGEHGDGF